MFNAPSEKREEEEEEEEEKCVQGGDGDTDLQKEHRVLEGNNKTRLIYI